MLCLFLFAPMPRGAFMGFQMIFLFSLFLLPEAERLLSASACPMNETGGRTQSDKPERMLVATRLNKFRRIGNKHTSFVVVCPFHASGEVFFFQTASSFYGFSPEVFSTQSASVFVYLHFAPFSEPHQAVISVLGAKVIPGLDGKARSSLLFSAEISSPSGSISPKNLAFPNPYLFKHPKRKRPMRQKDA